MPLHLPADAIGIFQPDVVIRTAIQAGLADLRANPWLLDYCFATLTKDALTANFYGQKEVQRGKEWFLQNNVPVVMATQMNSGDKMPVISIELTSSAEVDGENTLGDQNYEPRQLLSGPSGPWPDLVAPFTPTSWDADTGAFTIPAVTCTQADIVEGLVVVTTAGNQYPIVAMLEANVAQLDAGPNVDFSNCVIRPPRPSFIRHMESASFKEAYSIGIHCHGEPVYLTYLHSIMVFLLLRYREVLFEGRGFERSSFSSTEMARNAFFGNENVFSRYVNLNGYVRQFWPKLIVPRITSVMTQAVVAGSGNVPLDPVANPQGVADLPWRGSADVNPLDAIISGYGIRGSSVAPGPPDDLGPPDGAQGPAVAPATNGEMSSATENGGRVGFEGNLAVADDKGVKVFDDFGDDDLDPNGQ
jgi:hypothetical protein